MSTSQLDQAIAEVIAQRRTEMQQARELEEAQQAERRESERAANRAAWDSLEIALKEWQPRLAPYWKRPDDEDEPMRGIAQRVIFNAPGLVPFCAYFIYTEAGWQQTGTREGKYTVTRYAQEYDTDGDGYAYHHRVGSRWWYSFNTLQDALVEAQDEYQNMIALQAELDQETAARAAREQEREQAEAQRQLKQAQRAQREAAERDELIDAIANDPILVIMLKLHIAIKEERAGYRETIDNITDQLVQTDANYSERLSAAQREAKINADRAYEADIEASNARSEVYDAERKLKQAQRG